MGAAQATMEQEGQGFWTGLWEGSWAQGAAQSVKGWFKDQSTAEQINPYVVEGKDLGIPFLADIPVVGEIFSLNLTALGINGDTMFKADTWAKAREAIAYGALTGNKDIEEAVKGLEGKASGFIGGALGSFLGLPGMLIGYFGSGFVLNLVGLGFEAFGKKNPFAPGYMARFLVSDEAKAAALTKAQEIGAVKPEAAVIEQTSAQPPEAPKPTNVVNIGPTFDQAACLGHGGELISDGLICAFNTQVPLDVASMTAANDPDGGEQAPSMGTYDIVPGGP